MDKRPPAGVQLFVDGHWQVDADFAAVQVPVLIKDEFGEEESGGYVPHDALSADLEVVIPQWLAIPEKVNSVLLGWRPTGMPFSEVARFDFDPPVDPGDKTVLLAEKFLVEGIYQLSYKISVQGNPSPESQKKTVTIDLTPPDSGQAPKPVVFPAQLSGVITEEYLSREGEVPCQVPAYIGGRSKDVAEFFWTATNPPPDGEQAVGEVQFTQDDLDNDRLIIALDAQVVRQAGTGIRYLYYRLRDLVGNISPRSVLAAIEVDLTPLPENLKPVRVPLSARRLIDREHARDGATDEGGVTVEIDGYDHPSSAHHVVVNWDGSDLAEVPVDPAKFPMRVYVPWAALVANGPGPRSVQVDYRLRRGAGFTASPGPVSVPVDFTVAGQDHADAPALLNANLATLEVRGQVSDLPDALTSADAGLDAIATLTLFDNPTAGERIRLFWGEQQVEVAEYTVKAGDVAGQLVALTIPWAAIEPDLKNPQLPVVYVTDNGVNQQLSRATQVSVDISFFVGLKEPLFPSADLYGYLNCESVPKLWEGVTVRISGDSRFSALDRIELDWQGCRTLNGGDPIPGTDATFTKILTAAEAADGFDIVVDDYEKLIKPMADNNSATAQYRLYKVGGGIGLSNMDFVKITRTMPSGELCGPDSDQKNTAQ